MSDDLKVLEIEKLKSEIELLQRQNRLYKLHDDQLRAALKTMEQDLIKDMKS